MFAIYSIELTNFKCYVGEHSFEFPQQPGLYYLTGRNNFNTRLGANATGKSTIVDGINWCLYGKTSRGLRAGDIVSWGKKGCRVAVTFLVGEEEVEVVRTQSPNALSINGKPASQDEVNKLIRLNQEAFNCSVVLPQFGESFFDLAPAKKLEIFSQVMNLDYWLEKSKRADTKAGVLVNKISIAEQTIAKAEGKLDSLRDHVKELSDKSAVFAEQQAEAVKGLETEITGKKRIGDAARASLVKTNKKVKKAESDLVEVKEALTEAASEFETIEKKFLNIVSDIKTNDRHANELNEEVTDLEQLKGTVCSKCKQVIDAKHTEDKQSKLIGKINKLDAETSALNKQLKKLEGKRADLGQDVLELRNIRSEIEGEYSSFKNDAKNLQRDIAHTISLIDSLNENIAKMKTKENPFEAMIEQSKKQRARLKQDIKSTQEELDQLRTAHEAYSYWVSGFKRVRLFVIAEALTSLEVEVNNLLISLGLVGWKVTFDIERENKSGSVTKGFTVLIHSPKHEKPVKFESWSGGETQRLRLAGDLGLANLIMEQVGLDNQIEIIDEPTEHMSREGIDDLVETIHQRARDTRKQIWLVEHHSLNSTNFSGMLTSIMDEKGQSTLAYKELN